MNPQLNRTRPAPPLDTLRERLTGRLVVGGPGDTDGATPPATGEPSVLAVVEVVDARDVAAVVRFAAQYGLDVAVQPVGRPAPRPTRPTLLLRTTLLDELSVDPAGTARVGAGVSWQALLDAAGAVGLAPVAAAGTGTGVVDDLGAGGIGPLARSLGHASDHVLALEVVTGDGERRRPSSTEDTALFWGLRGGKGALGVVTAVELALRPRTDLHVARLELDAGDLTTAVRAWRRWAEDLPDAGSSTLTVLPAAGAPGLRVTVELGWVGEPGNGQMALADLAGSTTATADDAALQPYPDPAAAEPDALPLQRSLLLTELPEQAADALAAALVPLADLGGGGLRVELRRLGGALSGAPRTTSAVSHRDAGYHLHVAGADDPAAAALADALVAAVLPWSSGGTSPGFLDLTGPVEVASSYDAPTLTRLGKLAADYDPLGVVAAAHPVRATVPQRRMKFSGPA